MTWLPALGGSVSVRGISRSRPGPGTCVGPRCHAGAMTETLRIDCDTCVVRGHACHDCVVTVLLGPAPDQLGQDEQRALTVLADVGLVPPLRLVQPLDGPSVESA